MIFRVLLLLVGGAALAGSLAIERPERFAITFSSATLIVLLAAGSVASNAIPLQRIGLVCAIATLICGFGLLSRGEVHVPLAAAIVVLQLVAIIAGLGRLPRRTTRRA